MQLLQDPYSLAGGLKRVHVQKYVWLNAAKSTLPSLKVRRDYQSSTELD